MGSPDKSCMQGRMAAVDGGCGEGRGALRWNASLIKPRRKTGDEAIYLRSIRCVPKYKGVAP